MNVYGINSPYVQDQNQRQPAKELGKDEFLKILIAQLRYQDPLDGGDSTEYIAQLAQFSTLEQMQNINNNLEAGFSLMLYYQNIQLASGLVGKEVTIKSGDDSIQGIVEKTKISKDNIQIVVDGKAYDFHQVLEIQDSSLRSDKEETKTVEFGFSSIP